MRIVSIIDWLQAGAATYKDLITAFGVVATF